MSPLAETSCRLTVLFTDGPDRWQQSVRGLLEPRGVVLRPVQSGKQALDVLSREPIHVAVLENSMPEMNGLQVMKLLNATAPDASKVPPSILLADDYNPHLLSEALGSRVFSVLPKPVDLNVLLSTLARVLQRFHAGRWPAI